MINVSRKTLIIVLTALCIVWATLSGVRFHQRHSGKSDFKKIEITREIDLKLDTNIANIHISPSDTNTLRIESKNAGLIDVKQQQDTIKVRVDDKGSKADKTVFIKIPKGIQNIDIKTSIGDIDIEDITNNSAKLETSTGDISVHSLTADKLSIQTSIGDIDIYDTNTNVLDTKTSTGNIDIEVTADTVIAESSIGNISLDAEDINNIDIAAGTGDIYISLEDENGTFSIETSNIGKAYIFGDNVGTRQENLVYGTGKPIVKAKNSIGSIEIR